MAIELRAGQNESAKWYASLPSLQGQEKRVSVEPSVFWCVRTTAAKTTREFRDAIEKVTRSIVLASTNVSKLKEIDEKHGQVEYNGNLYNIASAEFSIDGTVCYIALS